MEQRIDSNIWPERAVGKDPAYVPGLMVPRPAGTAETDPEQAETEERAPEGGAPSDALPAAVPDEPALDANGTTTDKTEAADEVSSDASSEEDTPEDGASAEDGPVFEVTDRRGAIIADSKGVRFRLDDQEADFWWSEIGAVEIKTPRFGRRFTVTVHVSERRWFDAEVEADTRNRLKEWTEELDAVLDAYFEES
ncbi:hypothetical protein [Streptomyces sp. 35G-GA-8]|uniref:hypothetical protein n=1 Tax=Streptomyces sp. 35G-GA-8 TaxID=2939434 RepID=UPI00201F38AB|nr:hypothetical protein [Streptomyces sp. 35G-GA-8]MCL7381058.1 hypothetical protein [Streptomyces sp. 35G-GA-8]